MIKAIYISNYRVFDSFRLECDPSLNIIVGNNECGKSTILEAINLCLTRKLNGRFVDSELSSALFNSKCSDAYLASLKGTPADLPRITIEVYLTETPALAHLKGTNNEESSNSVGLRLEIAFDEDFREDYAVLLQKPDLIRAIPTEFYKVSWYSFALGAVTSRTLPIRTSLVDATTMRLQGGADHHLQTIINSGLNPKDRISLSIAYRHLKEHFSEEQALIDINSKLIEKRGILSDKTLSVAIDMSQRGGWETSLTPHLDQVPYHLIGKGEQNALKIMLALHHNADDSDIVLVEDPRHTSRSPR